VLADVLFIFERRSVSTFRFAKINVNIHDRKTGQLALEAATNSDRIRRSILRIFSEARRPRVDKLLIVGIDTLVGANLALTLSDRCEVVGISYRAGCKIYGCRTITERLTPGESLFGSIVAEHPDWIVYCGPTSQSSWDWAGDFHCGQESKQLTTISDAAKHSGSRLTLVSTDAVFRGPRLFHRESFPKAIDHPAANAARQLEKVVSADALIVRTHTYGWSCAGESHAENLWAALAENRPIAPSGTRYATPILASDLAELLWRTHCRRLSGVFHAGGAERASMWQFATAMAAASGTSVKILQLASDASGEDIAALGQARCGQESSLDSRKLQRAVESPLPLLREGLQRFVEQAKNGHRAKLSAALSQPFISSSAA
jgi:dTDP-4-dehydrorhamnose reductase